MGCYTHVSFSTDQNDFMYMVVSYSSLLQNKGLMGGRRWKSLLVSVEPQGCFLQAVRTSVNSICTVLKLQKLLIIQFVQFVPALAWNTLAWREIHSSMGLLCLVKVAKLWLYSHLRIAFNKWESMCSLYIKVWCLVDRFRVKSNMI